MMSKTSYANTRPTPFAIPEISRRITPILQSHHIISATLFGPYAKGAATPESDIDLCVDSHLRGLQFVGLIEDIRTALDDQPVDILDISHIVPGSAVSIEINSTGVPIYVR